MEDFLYSVKILESILMSYFTRHFGSAEKKSEVDSASKLREQSGFTVSWKYCSNLSSLKRLKVAPWEKICNFAKKMKNLQIVGFRAKFYALSVAKSVFSYLLYIFSNKALFTDWCTFIFPSNCHRYHISPLSYRILRPIYHFGVIVQSAFYLGIPVCKIHSGKERLKVIAGNLHSRFIFSR